MKKVFYNDYFMSEFVFDCLGKKLGYNVHSLANYISHKKPPFLLKLILWRVIPFWYIFLFYMMRLLQKKQINKCNKSCVLYFGIENIYHLTMLMYHNKNVERHVLWFWNPISSLGVNVYDKWIYLYLFIPLLKLVGVELWSFDKSDVDKYKLIYHPQIHNSVNLLHSVNEMGILKRSYEVNEHSFLFVGKDKGRLNKLVDVKDRLSELNVYCELYITSDEKKMYSSKDSLILKQDSLSYTEYLKKAAGFSGLIDFVQAGQSGVTLRALEALFLKKKLITNNKCIKDYDFYHPSNIFVIDEVVDDKLLLSFLKSGFVDITPDVLAKYDVGHLLNSVFR